MAFDAFIDASLCRQFPGPEYRGFFEHLNRHYAFPGFLLRPPPGWPQDPIYPRRGPEGAGDLLERLYPAPGERKVAMPFYAEILAVVAGVRPDWPESVEPQLMGDHHPAAAARACADPVFRLQGRTGECVRPKFQACISGKPLRASILLIFR